MTLPTHLSLLKTSKNSQNNVTTMTAIALMVFLLLFLTSLLAHADHLALQQTTVEQQDCQLCNQGLDTPPELPQIKGVAVSRYNFIIAKVTTSPFSPSYFVQPPSRAPPLFNKL